MIQSVLSTTTRPTRPPPPLLRLPHLPFVPPPPLLRLPFVPPPPHLHPPPPPLRPPTSPSSLPHPSELSPASPPSFWCTPVALRRARTSPHLRATSSSRARAPSPPSRPPRSRPPASKLPANKCRGPFSSPFLLFFFFSVSPPFSRAFLPRSQRPSPCPPLSAPLRVLPPPSSLGATIFSSSRALAKL
ncbi:uncharacterized protein SCHCODRAFT_02334177 [Schizophyllum commune H4-8]|uniref:uncharacterized protein n=1 Tax=Schizophyllum commune (strain H4-8 / FGSC 9210) TaxID=578458 RepID=UPI00215FBE8F|nr:uncharacterized protein SCHCODRAFT_02334177 [Schizophyllum commune H4-8]KAI5889995.1 hypothetical protein SCHCODRAFT_02334177 [Schizophyllum commune H4-8]